MVLRASWAARVALKYLCCCHRLLHIPAAKPPARQSEVVGTAARPPRGANLGQNIQKTFTNPPKLPSAGFSPPPGTPLRAADAVCFSFQPRGTPAARASPPRWTISILSTRLGKCAAFCPLPGPGRAPEAGQGRAWPCPELPTRLCSAPRGRTETHGAGFLAPLDASKRCGEAPTNPAKPGKLAPGFTITPRKL